MPNNVDKETQINKLLTGKPSVQFANPIRYIKLANTIMTKPEAISIPVNGFSSSSSPTT